MGKSNNPYNSIKESLLKVQPDIVVIKSDIEVIKNKLQKKGKKFWVILTIAGTLIIFLSSLFQNLLVVKLDREISKGSAFVKTMADFDTKLTLFQSQVQQNQIAYNANKNNMGLLINLCSSYASYCAIANNMERTFFEWIPIGTKLSQNETVNLQLKEEHKAGADKTLKKINEFTYKVLVDSLERYYLIERLNYYAYNENIANLSGEILIAKQSKRTKVKEWYTFFLLLGGLCTTIASFKAIYQ